MQGKNDSNFRYVMEIVEERHYTVAIDCNERKTLNDLKDIAENRRVMGEVSFKGVTEVDSWLDAAFVDGKQEKHPERALKPEERVRGDMA